MRYLITYKLFESIDNNIKLNIEDILLEFTDRDIPVEVYTDKLSSFNTDRLSISIGMDNLIFPFELDDDLIQIIEQMDEYLNEEGLVCEYVNFLKMLTTESGTRFSSPEAEVFEKNPVVDFLKFAKENKGLLSKKIRPKNKKRSSVIPRKVRMKYTFIEFSYKMRN